MSFPVHVPVSVMKKEDIPPPELIRKFLSGQCTEAERLQVQQWYASFDGEDDPLQELSATEQAALGQRMLDKVLHNTGAAPRPSRLFYRLLQAAAVILLVLGIRFLWLTVFPQQAPAAKVKPGYSIYNNSRNIGQQRLADGTVVWLKPGARVSYAAGFGTTHRHVTMSGEVFFDVTTNASLPFTVAAGAFVTRVLGTSFSVSAASSGRTEVTVISGKVAVHQQADSVAEAVLQPAQRITYLPASGRVDRDSLTVAAPSIWDGCKLNFNNAPVHAIIKALNERFAVNIIVNDVSLADYSLKADFSGMHLAAILEMLEKSLDARYEIKGDNIILEKNQANSRGM